PAARLRSLLPCRTGPGVGQGDGPVDRAPARGTLRLADRHREQARPGHDGQHPFRRCHGLNGASGTQCQPARLPCVDAVDIPHIQRAPMSRTSSNLRRNGAIAATAVVILAAAAWWWQQRGGDDAGGYRTTTVERGDIRVAISATGTLSAISTVTVGSQVSGQVTEVLVDFNDKVEQGQVIARIDPSTYEAQIEQGNAQVASAQAQLRQAQASLRNAELDYRRKAELGDTQLVARSDIDLARAALDQAQAQVNSA